MSFELHPLDAWTGWFKTRCEHDAHPVDWEVWDGAVETIVRYIPNTSIDDIDIELLEVLARKIKKRFLCHKKERKQYESPKVNPVGIIRFRCQRSTDRLCP
jgi:hypothetical protein